MIQTTSQYLPELPEDWSIRRLKHIAITRGGITLGRKIPAGIPTKSVPYLRVANVQAGEIDLTDVAEIEVTAGELDRYSLAPGHVLMNEGGDNDKLGRGAVWSGEIAPCIHQNHVFAVMPRSLIIGNWISACSNSTYGRDFFFLNSRQSTNLASISKSRLVEFPIPFPSQDEMKSILHDIENSTGLLLEIIICTQTSIDSLREFRSALITAAVTGQIDVATWGKRGETDRRLDQVEEAMRA